MFGCEADCRIEEPLAELLDESSSASGSGTRPAEVAEQSIKLCLADGCRLRAGGCVFRGHRAIWHKASTLSVLQSVLG